MVSRAIVRSGVLAAFVGVMLTGCVVAEPPGPVVTSPPPAPPPTQAEVIPVASSQGAGA